MLIEQQQRPCLSDCIKVSEQASGSISVQFHFLPVFITCCSVATHRVMTRERDYTLLGLLWEQEEHSLFHILNSAVHIGSQFDIIHQGLPGARGWWEEATN